MIPMDAAATFAAVPLPPVEEIEAAASWFVIIDITTLAGTGTGRLGITTVLVGFIVNDAVAATAVEDDDDPPLLPVSASLLLEVEDEECVE